tara:strand:- start:24976 stop:26544 length:1569 start_codon:yes stop_codon:yes gene_type:complete
MKEYKYKATFASEVTASEDNDFSIVSKASLEPLKDLVPESIDLDKNIDLLGVAFNAAVVNTFNKNGDGIETKSALSIADHFIHKPCNIEHQKNNIVGHVVSAGFSEYGHNNQFKNIDEAYDKPFNICLGAVVYKTVAQEFSDILLSSSDPESESYNSISASWEVGFNEYNIAVGSGDERKIINEESEIEEYSKYLKAFGGEGRLEDGTEVNRLIVGNIYPLGIGFTNNPAADVKGVIVQDDKNKENAKSAAKEDVMDKKVLQEKSSHLDNDTVIQKEEQFFSNIMEKTELLKDIEQLLSEKAAAKDFSDEAIANITKVFHDAIREKSEEYVNEIEKAKADQAEAQSAKEELSQTLSDLQEKLTDAENKLSSLEEEKAERESQARFDARMSALEDTYEFDDEDRKIVAAEISQLDETEESFAAYQEKVSVVFKNKNKEFLQKLAEEMEQKIQAEVEKRLSETAEASSTKTVEAEEEVQEEVSLDNVVEEEATISNNNGETIETETSLHDKFQQAFRDSVKITY